MSIRPARELTSAGHRGRPETSTIPERRGLSNLIFEAPPTSDRDPFVAPPTNSCEPFLVPPTAGRDIFEAPPTAGRILFESPLNLTKPKLKRLADNVISAIYRDETESPSSSSSHRFRSLIESSSSSSSQDVPPMSSSSLNQTLLGQCVMESSSSLQPVLPPGLQSLFHHPPGPSQYISNLYMNYISSSSPDARTQICAGIALADRVNTTVSPNAPHPYAY